MSTNDCGCEDGDQKIIDGINSPPVAWQFLNTIDPDQIFPLDGKDVYLKVEWPGGEPIEHNSLDEPAAMAVDLVQSTLLWTMTIQETHDIPFGRLARYRLEWHQGTDQGFLGSGYLIKGDGSPDAP